MNDFFNDLPATFGKTFKEDVFSFPPVNILENTDAYQLEVAAPGLEKLTLISKLDGKFLTISAEKKEKVKTETEKFIRKEFSSKAFKRSFTLDEKIEAASSKLNMKMGF